MFEEETIHAMWIKAHKLLTQALTPHPSFHSISKLLTLQQFLLHLGNPLPSPLFYVLIQGMFNTNNLNGGLYLLHSHLNHSCQPNVKVIDTKGRLSQLSGISP